VNISKKKVAEHRNNVRAFESKYAMASTLFLQRLAAGELSDDNPEYAAWRDQCAALERWEQRFKEFDELYSAWR